MVPIESVVNINAFFRLARAHKNTVSRVTIYTMEQIRYIGAVNQYIRAGSTVYIGLYN